MAPGLQYDVYAYVRGEVDPDDSGGEWALRAYFYRSDGTQLSYLHADYGGPGSLTPAWGQEGGRAPAQAATMKVMLLDYMNTGWVAFDDVTVYEAGSPNDLMLDGGFESGGSWTETRSSVYPATGFYRGTWGASAPHSGSYAYSISNLAYGGIDSNFISVKPSTPYTLQAYLHGELDPDDSAHNWQLRILYYNSSYTYLSYQDVDSGAPGSPSLVSWTQRTGSFTTLSNAAYLKVELRTQMTSGWITFDDITLQGGAEKVYYNAGGTRVAMRQNGALYWLLGDHLGSTSRVANSNGMSGPEERYKAWGESRDTSGTLPAKYAFTGQYFESTIGLYFYNIHWFDPSNETSYGSFSISPNRHAAGA